ncbi:MAG: outer membrane protein assembly factor BamA [Nitrospiraceae bacterium]|nr:MAG: outer membrane protein assembly factor BamA [Nitrospiraceae bacterium]
MKYIRLIILSISIFHIAPSITFAANAPVITAIEVEGLDRIEKEELIDMICFRTGDVFDGEALRTGIRRAFKKGIFLDIQAVADTYDGGIRLKYIVREIPVIRSLKVQGNKKISVKNIRDILPYREGEDFREEHLGKAEKALLDLYNRKGFHGAEVVIVVDAAGKKSGVDMYVHIREGKPLIINKIEIDDDFRSRLKIAEGDVFDRDKVEQGMKRLEEYLLREDYYDPVIGPYEFSGGKLVIPVRKGPRLELSFKGNSVISSKKLGSEAPFLETREVSDETVQEAIDRMRNLYLSKGYHYSQIAAGVEAGEDITRVAFIIHEGERVLLKKINFEGTSFSHKALRSIVHFEEGKPYNENLLSEGEESILKFYNALGYLKAGISAIEKNFTREGREVEVTIVIEEGPQTKTREIRIAGNKEIGEQEIYNELQSLKGSPYNVIDISDARYRVLSLYGRRGYPDAKADVESKVDNEDAIVTFRITENRPSVIGKIILTGNNRTKAKIIKREFTIKEGETYNYDELLKTRQKLYRLGIFNEVSIETLTPPREVDHMLARDMMVSLREGKAGSVEVSLGYGDYERFRTSLDFSYRNIGGYNRQAGFRAEASSVKQRFTLSFREPWLFNQPDLPFSVLLSKEDTRSVNLDTKDVLYETDRLSLLFGVEKEIRKGWKANLNYEYAFVDTKDVQPGVILSREDSGTLGIGSISPALFYDTRDDPFDPTTGFLQGIVIKLASKALLSETEFIKGTFQSSWFFPAGKGVVFAFSLRGGAAYSYDNIKELPLVERFFLGGRTTVRGYSNDTLGPKGADDTPTGGNVFCVVNSEFRVPIGKGFGLVPFLDAGNVWQLAEDIRPELKYTAGIGLRYKTPVGPVRIDYGHKMNRESGESSGELHYSFGHVF